MRSIHLNSENSRVSQGKWITLAEPCPVWQAVKIMGYSHILWVHNDGIREAKNNPEAASNLEQPIGKAVLKVCLDPYYEAMPEGGKRVNSEAVLNYGNCICWAGELHHTDEQVFVWGRNCLRTLDQLDDEELESAKRLLDEAYSMRKNKKGK